jgi:hypothetical protein
MRSGALAGTPGHDQHFEMVRSSYATAPVRFHLRRYEPRYVVQPQVAASQYVDDRQFAQSPLERFEFANQCI